MMKRGISTVCVLLLSFLSLSAADGQWDIAKISPAMLKNANMVVRLDEQKVEINSTHDIVITRHYVYTILNENADDWAQFGEGYDKLNEIESIDGTLYDAAGKELKSLKSKDLQDVSGVGSELMSDSRAKLHNFYYKVYPYTIEYTAVTKQKFSYGLPGWAPQPGEKVAVENSSVIYIFPADYQLRYKAYHYSEPPVAATLDKGKKSLTWSAKNVAAFLREPFQPGIHETRTYIAFAPSDFEMGSYKGNMNSWLTYGKFQRELNAGRDQLPDAVKQKVHALTDGVTDPFTKIRLLYEFMQQNTRYISIQLGIGGWQPFDANFVATKGYGDCKALTNYMYSLLKEAGIRSCYTKIKSGRNSTQINPEFPSNQFDHIILCVPLQKDSVWLECTDQTLPAGYLGDFTCDRYAMIVDDDGGKIVRTPKYGLNENVAFRKVAAELDDEATLHIKESAVYSGLEQEDYHGLIHALSKDKVKEYLHEELDFATYEVESFDYNEKKTMHPEVGETLDILVRNYATITGKRLFILPNVISRMHTRLTIDTTRRFDIELGYPSRNLDSVTIKIPAGYTAESVPQDVNLTTVYGTYTSSVKLSGDQLLYYRKMDFFGGRFPAAGYNDLVKFFEAVYKADRNKVVLVKNSTN